MAAEEAGSGTPGRRPIPYCVVGTDQAEPALAYILLCRDLRKALATRRVALAQLDRAQRETDAVVAWRETLRALEPTPRLRQVAAFSQRVASEKGGTRQFGRPAGPGRSDSLGGAGRDRFDGNPPLRMAAVLPTWLATVKPANGDCAAQRFRPREAPFGSPESAGQRRTMDAFQALVIAVLQGATELFPVSSLGHAVVLPALLGWPIDQHAAAFLPFLVLLHLGTATALLLFFWRDWLALAAGVLGIASAHQRAESRRVLLLIVVATVPAVIAGFLLERFVRGLFATPLVAAAFLLVNGLLLLAGERLRSSAQRPLSSLDLRDAVSIGLWQCTALIPGISRSGATIVGGLLRGVDHAGSAHFSFLIATPIILGATVLEVPKLLRAEIPSGVFSLAAVAAVVAGITAFLSTWFLVRYFRSHDSWALNPFAYYCFAAGCGSLALLVLR
jgi:undecaprenyl-diphosphatase